jgi:hypothetical protein
MAIVAGDLGGLGATDELLLELGTANKSPVRLDDYLNRMLGQ